jgi:hypothetical protein
LLRFLRNLGNELAGQKHKELKELVEYTKVFSR